MSKAEIIQELPKLTLAEREEIRLCLAEMDDMNLLEESDALTEAEITLLEGRIAAHERDPASAIPWEEFVARSKRRRIA